MIADLKPYPKTKASGLPWLGNIPSHWTVRRAKELFWPVDIRSETGGEELLTVSSARGVVPRSTANVTMFKAESYEGHKLCWPGDLVINSLWAWAQGLGVTKRHGIVSTAYGVYRLRTPFKSYAEYVHQLVRSVPFQWELQVRSKGIWISRLQLTDEAFFNAPFPVPSPDEQAAIVRFLDHTDRRIRHYIRAKQKVIKLLEEQKRSVISRTILGEEPGVGDVLTSPARWPIVRLKSLVSKVTSGSRGWSNYAADDGPLFLRIGNLTRSTIGLDLAKVVRLKLPESAAAEAVRTKAEAGDVLISITADIGSVAVVPNDLGEAYISQHVACCRPLPARADAKWIAYVIMSPLGQAHSANSMYGGTKQGLSLDDVKNYSIPVPPPDEQVQIVRAIEQRCKALDDALLRVRREIALVRELQTCICADVVTGKLDVREAATKLPAEALPEDVIDEPGAEALEGDDQDAAQEEEAA